MTNSSKNDENMLVDLEIISDEEMDESAMDQNPNAKPPVMTKKSNQKIPLIIGGIAGTVLLGGFVMLMGLVMLMAVASSGGGSAGSGSYANGYGGGYGGGGDIHRGPNGGWIDQSGWGTRHTSGTVDPYGPNSVHAINGRVINMPN